MQADLPPSLVELQQENDRLQAELAQLRQENDRLRQSEARSRQTPLLSTVATVANLLLRSPDYNTVLPDVVRLLGEAVGSDRCVVAQCLVHLESGKPAVRVGSEWECCQEGVLHSDEFSPHTDRLFLWEDDTPYVYEKMRQGKVINALVTDIPEPDRNLFIAQGNTAELFVPIWVDRKLWGFIAFDNCGEPRLYDEAEIAILQVAAESLAAAIARQAKDEELRDSEKRYRTLFELSSEGIVRFGYEQPIPIALPIEEQVELCYRSIYIAEANDAYARMFEHKKVEDTIGLTLNDFHDRNSEITQATMRDWVENQYACRSVETVELDRHGRKRYFLNSAASTIENGCVVCTWVSQVDITQLREAQQALLEVEQARVAELVKANEALRNAIAGLARLDNLDSFLAEMLKVSLEVSGAHGGTVCLIERDMVRHAVLFDKAGWVSPEVQAERGTLLLPFSPELRLMAQRILESEDAWAVLPDDPLHPPSFQAFHREQGNRAIRLVPMRIGNRLLGWLGLGFAQEDPPLGRSFALLRVLAEQMTMAVEILRLAEEAKQSALAKLNEVIACEREKAATQRAAELAKANDALRRGVERLVASGTLDAALDAFLLEAMSVTEAAAGAILERGTGSEFIMQALAQDGKIVKPFDPHSSEDLYRKRTAADPTGVMRRTAAGEIVIIPVEDIESWFPEAAAYHRNCGHRTVWHFPFQVGGEVVGFLGLAFREAKSPNDVLRETVQALAHQASLALESQRLAERAKLAAIAQEQERAASERAAELAKANEALKRSLTMLALEPSLDKLLGYVLQAISDSLGDRSGAVYLFDDSDNTTSLHLNYENGQMQQGEQIDHPAATLRRPPKEWDTQYLPLLRQNQVLIHHEAEFASPAYNPYRQHNAQRGIKTLLFVPLLFGEQLLGSITLRSTQHRNYTPEELELARALAHQATLAIQLTRLAAQGCKQAILEERNRMARDIHDSLAQAFTGIILQLEAAKRKIAATQPEAAQNCLSRARSLAASGLSEARRSVRALRPEALESDDLPSALYYIVEQMSWNTDVKITLQIDGTPRPIPIDVEINLLRIGQEALTNAVRHADAQNIRLNLLFEPEAVHLQIRDDGRGFQPQVQLTNGGFGLIGMQERSRQIGAQLRLVSSIGRGTEAIVTVPV